MNRLRTALSLVLLLLLPACGSIVPGGDVGPARPPAARVVPVRLEAHGHVRVDEYYWLRNRDDPAVIAHLEAENAYTAARTAHTAALRERIFEEIKGRIEQADASVPFRKGEFLYYSREEEGKDYPIHCRRRGSMECAEEVMIDANALAAGHDFFSLRGLSPRALAVSPDGRLLAYAVDFTGRRFYTIRFRDLETGRDLGDAIADTTGNMAWANDSRTLFYTRQDPVTLRAHRVFSHSLGADPSGDRLVHEETDAEFRLSVSKTKSEKFLMIHASQTLSDEWRFLDAGDPGGEFRLFHAREKDLKYSVYHHGDHFFVRTNLDARNFRLMKTPLAATGKAHWIDVIPHREGILLQGVELFDEFLVLSERRRGLTRLGVLTWALEGGHQIDFGEPAYAVSIGPNPAFDTRVLRYVYSSLTTPESTYDYDMRTGKKTLLKQDLVPGGFDPADYRTERLLAPARDGQGIPVTLLRRADRKTDGAGPLLLYGYGSYGATIDARFKPDVLSLVDRGFVYAIAHVRGSQTLGRRWYEEGKLLRKRNTFTDFIDCAAFLVREGYASRERVFAMGGSAGGLLVGAAINMRPDLFRGVVAQVPFVDVVTTMLDATIPLTTSEYDEWGNPEEKVYHDYMLSYSPYDNVAETEYPDLLVTAGLHDSQVQYWEPAKWVARLRARKTGESLLLLKTNMRAGHGGASARDERYRETAFAYAFLLDLAGER